MQRLDEVEVPRDYMPLQVPGGGGGRGARMHERRHAHRHREHTLCVPHATMCPLQEQFFHPDIRHPYAREPGETKSQQHLHFQPRAGSDLPSLQLGEGTGGGGGGGAGAEGGDMLCDYLCYVLYPCMLCDYVRGAM